MPQVPASSSSKPSVLASIFLPELLALIFQECVEQAHDGRTRGPAIDGTCPFHFCYPDCLSWIKVTHVCRHWRQTALSHPSLWTRIPTFSTFWTELFLARAGSRALHIYFNAYPAPGVVTSIQPSEALGQRIQELVIKGASLNVMSCLDQFGKLPRLLSLSMSFPGRGDGHRAMVVERGLLLPEHFLSDRAPHLKALHLYSCAIRWKNPPPLFCRITSLSIHQLPYGQSLNMGELLSLMSATPMLEQLVLGDCLKGLNSGPGQTMQVTARNLKCLKFFGLADVLREGLSHIQLLRPLTHLHIENRNPDITSFSYFLPCISTWHIPKLNSSEGNRSQYELSLARTRASRQLSDSSYRVRILVPQGWDATAEHITRELCVETVLSTAGLRDIFQYLFTLLPIRLLTSFTISTAGWQGFGLRSTLKNATSLRSLSIAPPDLVQVASLLSCRSVGDMPARNLEELTLDMELPSVFNPGPQPHATFTGLEELRECILLRRAYGHPVHRVVFKYCTPEDSYAFAGMQWEKVEDLGIELVFIVEVGCGRFVQNEKYSLQSFLALASRA